MPLSDGVKSLTICAFASIQYQRVTDRQTDGQTDLPLQYRALHAMRADMR